MLQPRPLSPTPISPQKIGNQQSIIWSVGKQIKTATDTIRDICYKMLKATHPNNESACSVKTHVVERRLAPYLHITSKRVWLDQNTVWKKIQNTAFKRVYDSTQIPAETKHGTGHYI